MRRHQIRWVIDPESCRAHDIKTATMFQSCKWRHRGRLCATLGWKQAALWRLCVYWLSLLCSIWCFSAFIDSSISPTGWSILAFHRCSRGLSLSDHGHLYRIIPSRYNAVHQSNIPSASIWCCCDSTRWLLQMFAALDSRYRE